MKKQAFHFVLYSLILVCISLALGGCPTQDDKLMGVYVYDANNQFLGYLSGGIMENGDDRYEIQNRWNALKFLHLLCRSRSDRYPFAVRSCQ